MVKLAKNFWGKVKEWYFFGGKNPADYQYEQTDYSEGRANIAAGLYSAVTFALYYLISFRFCLDTGLQDMKSHASFAQNFNFGDGQFLKAWLRVPYMLWHLVVKFFNDAADFPIADAAAFTFALFGVFAFAVTSLFLKGIFNTYTGKNLSFAAYTGAFALCFAGPLNCMWLGNGDAYGNAFSPNPLHNPTNMAVKGFGMLLLMAGIDIVRMCREESAMFFKKTKFLYLYFGIFLFLSVIAKPTFMYMLVPAGFIVILIDIVSNSIKKNGKAKDIWKVVWKLLLASIPSIIYFVLEYLAFYLWGEETNGMSIIFTKPFEIWHVFTPSVRKSVLLGMCFPLYMFVTRPGYFLRTVEGRLGFIGYIVGVLEFTFIAENGERYQAGNFAWCMMAGMAVFFAVAVARLIIDTFIRKETKGHGVYVTVGWALLFLHVYSGMYYYDVFKMML